MHGISKDTVEDKMEGVSSNGIFTVEYPSGEMYKGEVHNDKREGYGEYYYANGVVYRGDWMNDHEHGKGEYSRGDDVIYKGEFSDGRMNGFGVYYYDNGDVYEVWHSDINYSIIQLFNYSFFHNKFLMNREVSVKACAV